MAFDHPHSNRYLFQQIANTRDTVRLSSELLRGTKPDTFAGRKTQEAFPTEDPMQRADIKNLINRELQPPKS